MKAGVVTKERPKNHERPRRRFPVAAVLDAVGAAKARGWHESRGSMSRGLCVVAVLTKQMQGLGTIATGAISPVERIADKRETILALLERALARD